MCAIWFGAALSSSACHDSATVVAQPNVSAWLVESAASASLTPAGDSVSSSLTITNTASITQTVQFAPCTYLGPLTIRAYVPAATKPAWESALLNNTPCFTGVESVVLKAGASHTFVQVTAVNDILGDSLASGSYVLTVSGRYLTPSATTELVNSTIALTKRTVPPATFSFTTDQTVYSATAGGTAPFIQYSFTVIARYANVGAVPDTLLNACGPHPSWEIVGSGNNVGISEYDPGSLCLVPSPPMVVAPGAFRLDTIQFTGPVETAADGTTFSPLYGQFRITYRAGSACIASTQPCVQRASNVFAVQIPQ